MEQKRFVKGGLTTDNLRAYVGLIEDEVLNYIYTDSTFHLSRSERGKKVWAAFDIVKVLQEIAILTAARTLQGKEVRACMDKTFAQLYNDLDGGFTPIVWMFPNAPLERVRKRDRAQKKMSEFYVSIIKNRRERLESAVEDDASLLTLIPGGRNADDVPRQRKI
jgi:sterol 14-demethylase